MAIQRSVACRNAENDAFATTAGAAPTLEFRTGAPEANAAASDGGSLLATLTLPSTPFAASSSGAIAKSGTWSGTASGTGTAGHYRLKTSGGTVVEQGTVGMAVTLSTSALTAANGSVLTFSGSPTGVSAGMKVSGTGVATGAVVSSVVSSTVIMSLISTAGVASAASITFNNDIDIDNSSIASGQTITVASFSRTAGEA